MSGLGCSSVFLLLAITGYRALSGKSSLRSVSGMFRHFYYPSVPTRVEAANVQEHRQLTLDVIG